MGTLVSVEAGEVSEALSTVRTLVGLLTHVGLLVGKEVEFLTDKCVTFIGFLREVQTLMVNKFFEVFLGGTRFPRDSTSPLPAIFILTVLPPVVRLTNSFCGVF